METLKCMILEMNIVLTTLAVQVFTLTHKTIKIQEPILWFLSYNASAVKIYNSTNSIAYF
jgi:hypothetical protein